MRAFSRRRFPHPILLTVPLMLLTVACGRSREQTRVLTADMPLHLEDHLDAARVEGSELPKTIPTPVEWRFDQAQPDWKATPLWNPPYGAPALARTGEGPGASISSR